MSFPVFDPTQGVELTANGRDVKVYWPADEEWLLYVVRTALWQFKGSWKYDLSRGVPYLTDVLGQVPSIPLLQSIFRKAIGRYAKIDRLTVAQISDEEIRVTFRGPATLGQDVSVNLFEAIQITPIVPEAAELRDDLITIRFTEELNPYALPEPSDFELLNTDETVLAVSVSGTHVFLYLTGSPLSARAIYRKGLTPLKGISQTLVDDFVIDVSATEGFLIVETSSGFLSVETSTGFLEIT